MGRTALSTQLGFMQHIAYVDLTADLPRIACPTLVIIPEESGLASAEETRAWQEQIPRSRLLVLPGNSYHAAATHADQCAQATRAFLAERHCAVPHAAWAIVWLPATGR